jgi:hypothetical protein
VGPWFGIGELSIIKEPMNTNFSCITCENEKAYQITTDFDNINMLTRK